jgi:S1-C subfamily serine protease
LRARDQIPKSFTPDWGCCRQTQIIVLGVVMLFGSVGSCLFARRASQEAVDELKSRVYELAAQIEQLKREQSIPASALNRYRNSIGYICGVYRVGFERRHPEIRMRVTGSGFLVGDGLVATNRHVAQPWYGNLETKRLIDRGASATVESLIVFFPNSPKPIKLLPGAVSKNSDLAVLRLEDTGSVHGLAILPLAVSPGSAGQLVTVMGYPLGTLGLIAKSRLNLYERLAYRRSTHDIADLAAMSLIRPSITYGHLGDVVGDTIVYDAPSAHGGSGGPVLNSRGEVIGVNTAYLDGFSGSTLGTSVENLRPLIEEVLSP